jgi:hypothetical protein
VVCSGRQQQAGIAQQRPDRVPVSAVVVVATVQLDVARAAGEFVQPPAVGDGDCVVVAAVHDQDGAVQLRDDAVRAERVPTKRAGEQVTCRHRFHARERTFEDQRRWRALRRQRPRHAAAERQAVVDDAAVHLRLPGEPIAEADGVSDDRGLRRQPARAAVAAVFHQQDRNALVEVRAEPRPGGVDQVGVAVEVHDGGAGRRWRAALPRCVPRFDANAVVHRQPDRLRHIRRAATGRGLQNGTVGRLWPVRAGEEHVLLVRVGEGEPGAIEGQRQELQ